MFYVFIMFYAQVCVLCFNRLRDKYPKFIADHKVETEVKV